MLLQLAADRGMARTPAREKAAIALGKMLVSDRADEQYLGRYVRHHRDLIGEIADNTAGGAIGLLEPTIFHPTADTLNHTL